MSCKETLRTQSYLDGELQGAEAAAAEQHLETCAQCQALAADTADLSDALRKAARHRASDALRARVTAALDRDARPIRFSGFWLGAASGGTVSALAAGFALLALSPPSAASLSQSIVEAHAAALVVPEADLGPARRFQRVGMADADHAVQRHLVRGDEIAGQGDTQPPRRRAHDAGHAWRWRKRPGSLRSAHRSLDCRQWRHLRVGRPLGKQVGPRPDREILIGWEVHPNVGPARDRDRQRDRRRALRRVQPLGPIALELSARFGAGTLLLRAQDDGTAEPAGAPGTVRRSSMR